MVDEREELNLANVGIVTPNLECLAITNPGIFSLSLDYLENLKRLSIFSGQMRSEVFIPALRQLHCLEELTLSIITDPSSNIMVMNELLNLPALRKLTLEGLLSDP